MPAQLRGHAPVPQRAIALLVSHVGSISGQVAPQVGKFDQPNHRQWLGITVVPTALDEAFSMAACIKPIWYAAIAFGDHRAKPAVPVKLRLKAVEAGLVINPVDGRELVVAD